MLEQALPYSDIVNNFKAKCMEENYKFLSTRAREKNKSLYYFQHYPSTKPFPKFSLNRRDIVSINRLRSGHNSLKNSLFKCNIVDSYVCSCEQGLEDVNHIFWYYSKYDRECKVMIGKLKKRKIRTFMDIREILKDMRWDMFEVIIEFIKNSKLEI